MGTTVSSTLILYFILLRLETDAIRPLFAESTKTLADVLQRLYYNMIQFNNLSQKKPDQNNIGFVAK
jgi:hypothetical protein